MEFIYKPYLLEFKHPFGVSSNTRSHTPALFVRIEHNGVFGYGEACLPVYLGESVEETTHFLNKAREIVKKMESPFPVKTFREKIQKLSKNNNAAKAAMDIALIDLAGKIANRPFYDLMNFGKSEPVFTSCTIGIDDEKMIEKKIEEAGDFSILKIKAGTKDDKALVNLIRYLTDKPLYVDVNQGWKDTNYVIDMIGWMAEKNVLLVEQPMPVAMIAEMALVTEKSPIPTIADESVKQLSDIDKLKGVFSGINIKLMKCGGMSAAEEMARYARKNNFKVMLGCMAESSCATSAMAQLMGMADFIDLDAPNLIVNDPFEGITYQGGKVVLNDEPGIGVRLKEEFLKF